MGGSNRSQRKVTLFLAAQLGRRQRVKVSPGITVDAASLYHSGEDGRDRNCLVLVIEKERKIESWDLRTFMQKDSRK